MLVANPIEALLAIGAWDEADQASAAALRANTANFPYMLLMLRADLELGRGEFDAARAHLDAALRTLREDRGRASTTSTSPSWPCGSDAGRTPTRQCTTAWKARAPGKPLRLRVWFCAKGLRAQAELAALARARRDTEAAHAWLAKARTLIAVARRGAQRGIGRHAERRRLARAGRGRVRARPGHRPARIVVRSRCGLGAARPRRPSRPTAAGARPSHSSPPAPPAPRQADRSGRRTPSPHASAPSRCCANSTSSPSAPGSTPTHPKVSHPTAGTTYSSRSASRDARQRYSASSPAATPTARSPTRSSSASRPPASTSRTSCESSTRPTGARRPRSHTASPTRPSRTPSAATATPTSPYPRTMLWDCRHAQSEVIFRRAEAEGVP